MGEDKIREERPAAAGARRFEEGVHVSENRVRVAHLLRTLRVTWFASGKRGKWARFRMAWLADKHFDKESGYRKALGRHVEALANSEDFV